ncbi:2OG-Fe(II) oxygenase [Sinomicrobium oceani]|uniref:2OG-Fe(II) oxygenase n=1 Tax=Sinomicrobium oceani TaxID=1150368 RepID=UPI00227A986C|nr:2OG-Fe(II) oxygenase [Sinomicrobium oceani]
MKHIIETVDSKKIHIIDGVLTKEDVENFYLYLSRLSYFKVEKANDDDQLPKFSRDLRSKIFETQSVVGIKAKELVKELYQEDYILYRTTINLILKGDMEFPHRDVSIPRNDITVLYYANNLWDYKWGGETIFYEEQDSKIGILPMPGRYVVFEGYVEHKAGIPTFFSKQPRYTLALKFISKNNLLNQIEKENGNIS